MQLQSNEEKFKELKVLLSKIKSEGATFEELCEFA